MVRFKNRYLLCEVVWADGRIDESVSGNTLYYAIRDALVRHFGDFGIAAVLQSFQSTRGPHASLTRSLRRH